jgi:NADPH-dependent ferric siderophore reductase
MTARAFDSDGAKVGFPWIRERGWMRRRRGRAWSLMVANRQSITPRMTRISLVSDDLATLAWTPGQDMVLELPLQGGVVAPRHYTIRGFDAEEQRIDFDLFDHGGGASAQWLAGARTGDTLIALGPRGRTRIAPDVEKHLFIGDETAIPAILAMARSLGRNTLATALIEVESEEDAQPLAVEADVTVEWRYRRGAVGETASLLLDRLEALRPNPWSTQAYVLGETGQVRQIRHYLMARGFDRARITAEGYWRPGRIGGHDHV